MKGILSLPSPLLSTHPTLVTVRLEKLNLKSDVRQSKIVNTTQILIREAHAWISRPKNMCTSDQRGHGKTVSITSERKNC